MNLSLANDEHARDVSRLSDILFDAALRARISSLFFEARLERESLKRLKHMYAERKKPKKPSFSIEIHIMARFRIPFQPKKLADDLELVGLRDHPLSSSWS